MIIILLLIPTAGLVFLACKEVLPDISRMVSFLIWNIESCESIIRKYRSHQQIITKHVLSIYIFASWIIGEFQDHCSHDRHSSFMSFLRHA